MRDSYAEYNMVAPFVRVVETDGKREFHLLAELTDHSRPGLYHWVSTDLISWTPVADKETVLNTNSNAKAAAPEWIYDEGTGNYYIYWTCDVNGKSTIFYSTTKDWQRFSTPRQYFDPETSTYDVHIERMGDAYYAFFYTENRNLCVATSTNLNPTKGKFGEAQRLFASGVFKVRAPQTFAALDGTGWFMATLNTNGTGPSMSATGNPAELKWYSQDENNLVMPAGVQQGSVITITRAELNTLLRAYSYEEFLLLPTAETEPQTWKYNTSSSTSDSWNSVNFNDDKWREDKAGFGAGNPPNSITNTTWTTSTIYLRKRLDLTGFDDAQLRSLEGRIYHDEDVKVYLNGVLAFEESGYQTSYKNISLSREALATLTPSADNVVAIECKNAGGGQYIDFGLTAIHPTTVGVQQPTAAVHFPRKGIYNLSGQRLASPQAGINIIDGVKVAVK